MLFERALQLLKKYGGFLNRDVSYTVLLHYCRSVPGAIGYGDPREIKQHLEDHGIRCWIDVERVGQVCDIATLILVYINQGRADAFL